MDSLLHELKRRNVFKVGIAYLALGWVVIQVTESAVPALNLPETLNSIVFYLGIIGFPFALLFAWAFELTPDGIKRSHEVEDVHSIAQHTGRKLDFVIIAFLTLALIGVVYDSYLSPSVISPETTSTEAEQNITPSIAVLAFENISPDKNQDYFADGISEEILNLLAKTQAMKVAGRTSSFSFKGKDDDIPTIAKKLKVGHILEGSIRKSGTMLRITAQLIRDDGYHVWSETYDREMDDIFKIQDEISTAIMKELKVHLLGEIAASPERGTDNAAAYEKYVMAKELLRQRRRSSIDHAVTLLREVVTMDPGYASAYAQLAIAYSFLSSTQYGDLSLEEEKRLSSPAIEKATAIDPDNVDVLAAQGLLNNDGVNDIKALTYLDRALKIQPNHADARRWKGNILGTMGRNAESQKEYKYIVDRDPLWVAALNNYADSLTRSGRFDKVEEIITKIDQLSPDANFNANLKAQLFMVKGMQGDGIITYLENNGIKLSPFDYNNLNFALRSLDLLHLAPVITRYHEPGIEIARGNLDKARQWAERELKSDNDPFTIHQAYHIIWRLGDEPRARDMARLVFEKNKAEMMQNKPHFFACYWGPKLTYLLQKELDDTTKTALLSSCKGYIDNSKESRSISYNYLEQGIHISVAEGNAEEALAYLKTAVRDNYILFDPVDISLFNDLKALPEFPAVMASIEARRKEERDKVLAWREEHPDALKRLAQ